MRRCGDGFTSTASAMLIDLQRDASDRAAKDLASSAWWEGEMMSIVGTG